MRQKRWSHIYPLEDTVEHYVDGRPCWCQPHYLDDELVVLHNSMDMRELLTEIIEVLH